MRRVLLVSLMLCAVVFAGGCIQNSPLTDFFAPSADKIGSAKTATVADFVQSYNENSVKANSDYAGHWVKIRGLVTDIRKIKPLAGMGGTDSYFVGLKDDTGKTKSIITCRFNFNKASELKALKAGSIMTFYGKIDELDGTSALPVITDCQIVKTP